MSGNLPEGANKSRKELKGSADRNKRYSMWQSQNGACFYCNKLMWVIGYHPVGKVNSMATNEHILPPKLGGSRRSHSNLVCSCAHCNRSRGQIEHEKFVQIRKQSNWQELAREEKWRIDGIYDEQIMKRSLKKNLRIQYKNRVHKINLLTKLGSFKPFVYV